MNEFVQTRDGIVGQVKAKIKLASGLALGLDVSGNGDMFYVAARDVKPFDIAPKTEVTK